MSPPTRRRQASVDLAPVPFQQPGRPLAARPTSEALRIFSLWGMNHVVLCWVTAGSGSGSGVCFLHAPCWHLAGPTPAFSPGKVHEFCVDRQPLPSPYGLLLQSQHMGTGTPGLSSHLRCPHVPPQLSPSPTACPPSTSPSVETYLVCSLCFVCFISRPLLVSLKRLAVSLPTRMPAPPPWVLPAGSFGSDLLPVLGASHVSQWGLSWNPGDT